MDNTPRMIRLQHGNVSLRVCAQQGEVDLVSRAKVLRFRECRLQVVVWRNSYRSWYLVIPNYTFDG